MSDFNFEDTFDPKYQGAFDVPDSKDYQAEHIFGEPGITPPSKVDLSASLDHVHDQKKTWHCTSYGLTHVVEILNSIEHGISCLADPEEQWRSQCAVRGVPAIMGGGDTLLNALKAYIKNGLTNEKDNPDIEKFHGTEYAKTGDDLETMKKWLALGFPLYTGSGNHCYAIVGYDNSQKSLIALNSYGMTGKLKGRFLVPYTQVSKLFSKYIIYDKKDAKKIYRDVTDASPMAEAIQYCLDKKIMTGYGTEQEAVNRFFHPEKPISRAEMAQILFNLRKV